jgi:hypothetical protein
MKFNIKWLVKKSPEWIVAELVDDQGKELKEVSINKVSKKGELFPSFDELQPGRDVEGELWVSQAGKNYLFPPRIDKPRGGASGAFKTAQIEKTMDLKNQNINKALDRKEDGIAIAGAQRDAVLITTTLLTTGVHKAENESDLKLEIIKWRNWFLSDEFKNTPPF